MAYKLKQAIGDADAGCVVHLEEEVGSRLVESGLAELATAEDTAAEETSEEADEEPLVKDAIASLTTKIEDTVSAAVAKIRPAAKETVPATPKRGPIFKTVGAYVRHIIKAECFGDKTAKNMVMAHQDEIAKEWTDRGIVIKAPTGMNEGQTGGGPAQGGFLINTQFSPDVYAIPHNQINLLDLCGHQVPAQSLLYSQRYINETSLANQSIFGGLNMTSTGEAVAFQSSLPAFANLSFQLAKFGLFVYFTSELIEDNAYQVESMLNEYAVKTFLYGLNGQFIQGSTLEGLVNSPGAVTYQTNEGATLSYATVAGMFAAAYPDAQVTGVWLMHPLILSSLLTMTYTGSGGTSPAWGLQYDAQNGLAGAGAMTPYRLFGRPLYVSYACSAPGTAGDVIFYDPQQCLQYFRPFRVEVSRDFHFSVDEIAVRYVARTDCKTLWRNRISPPNGSAHQSAVVMRGSSGSS